MSKMWIWRPAGSNNSETNTLFDVGLYDSEYH